jgi:16S rRNA processing protein RimM
MVSRPDSARQKFVTVARIIRPRGNKGEVAARLLTDFPDRLGSRSDVILASQAAPQKAVKIEAFWVDRNHPDHCVFHFSGVSSIAEAERLRGFDVQIPWEERAIVEPGTYFVTDLIGASVFELPAHPSVLLSSPCSLPGTPSFLGQVRDVYFPGEGQPGTPLLAVDTRSGEVLVPFAEDICKKIDLPARRIEVLLPPGLRDLNRDGDEDL